MTYDFSCKGCEPMASNLWIIISCYTTAMTSFGKQHQVTSNYVTKATSDETWVSGNSYTTVINSDLTWVVCQIHKMASREHFVFFRWITIQEMFIVLQRILILQLLFYLVWKFFYSYGKRISISTHLELWWTMAWFVRSSPLRHGSSSIAYF